MAQRYVSSDGVQVVPGSTVAWTVKTKAQGSANAGVLMIVGEADAGPDWTLETKLADNGFGPDEDAAVRAKYKSGPIMDSFLAAAEPLNDPEIQGSPSKIIIVKTNKSTKASGALIRYDGTNYGTLFDKNYGTLGNLIYLQSVANATEVVPTTGSVTWIPNVGTVNTELRLNGGSALALALVANQTPAQVQAAIDALAGVGCTGGALRTVLPGISGNVTLTVVSGNSISIAYSGTFTTIPSIGDTLVITGASLLASAGGAGGSGAANAAGANVGAYVVTAATGSSVSATKLSDAGKTGAVAGTITAPVAVTSTAVAATTDIGVYAPIVVSVDAGNPIPGQGKSLEVAELTTGTDLLSRCLYALSTTAVTWVSKLASPQLLTSATEYQVKTSVQRQVDGLEDDLVAGGRVALKVSYKGTTASLAITATTITATATGGSGSGWTAQVSGFPTVGDLVAFINSQTGWSATAGSAVLGTLPTGALDQATFNCASTQGAQNGRIKVDAYDYFNQVSTAQLVQLGNPVARLGAGLPGPQNITFLSGGARGATTASGFIAAIDALEKVRGNFLIPLFSRDATPDITAGLTDPGSSYSIDAIHTYCRTHVLKMSKRRARKNRQTFLSIQDTFANAKQKAAALNSFRCSMSFLDQKVVTSDGTIKQLPPYIDAVIAAAGQAAGFYKPIVGRVKNVNGSVQAAGDWDSESIDQKEDALQSGLLPSEYSDTGSVLFTSDQTTYCTDDNPVWNSIQAVYVADLMSLDAALQMEKEYRGKTPADINKNAALAFLESLFDNYIREKLLVPSDAYPKGYDKVQLTIDGPAMIVNALLVYNGGIYFIPITFAITPTQQSVSA